jgi:hypothetical protein
MLAVSDMPTKLKRVDVALDAELQAALEKYALRSKRSLSNAASILLEQALIVTGDLPGQIERKESRGGKRTGSGRPKAAKDATPGESQDADRQFSDEPSE